MSTDSLLWSIIINNNNYGSLINTDLELILLAQDMYMWKDLINMVMNFWLP
jgi:hypothetical protein